MPSSDLLRKQWCLYCELSDRYFRDLEQWRDLPTEIRIRTPEPRQQITEFPEELRGLACGARTRAGHPCRLTSIYQSGRCKFHGGLSTGPTSAAGKRKAAKNGFRPKKKRSP